MAELLRAAEMRALEQGAIASGAVAGLALMERAAEATVAAALRHWPALAAEPQRVLLLCGPGNNGGDGLAIARLLAGRGWRVAVLLLADPARLPPDARANLDRLPAAVSLRIAAPVEAAAGFEAALAWLHGAAPVPGQAGAPLPQARAGAPVLLVDALFGTGLGRPARAVAPVLRAANAPAPGRLRLAVDVPSGICADSGRLLQPPGGGAVAFAADLTVTFHRAKPGHFIAEGARARGVLVVADIGLTAAAAAPSALHGCEAPQPAALDKTASAHKFGHGHALILAGGPGHGGAARLAARAALRIGAGLVTLAAPEAALAENAARLDAVMLAPLADAAALRARLADSRLTALCLGPGLGTGAREAGLLAAALGWARQNPRRGLVLDADALTLLARPRAGSEEGRESGEPWLTQAAPLGGNCVLTPHMGEFARLFPDLAARLAAPAEQGPAFSKLDAALAATARAGCTLLLKGPDTVIADACGAATLHAAVAERAAPWLATAGAGDVLAGMIAGLLARGWSAREAAAAAVWLHVEAARRFGPGLIAEDLPGMLPGVLRALGL